jgi:AraC-like DNA-binding protein
MPYQREQILPTGTVELIINFGSPFRLYDHAQPARFTYCTDSWLVGLQTGYLLNEPVAETYMIGVRFKPGGSYPFFRLPASELHNQVAPLEALWERAAELREILYAETSFAARCALLERLLLARLAGAQPGRDPVRFAVDMLAQHHGTLSIKALCGQIGISQKHLSVLFRQVVGVTPKALARIYRFQRVLQSIDPARAIDWAEIAQEARYYDQAHFNRDFAAFTGLSPTEYMRRRRQVFGDLLTRGEDVHFVPIG